MILRHCGVQPSLVSSGKRNQEKNSSLEDADRQADGDERRGSEPTTSHSTEHKSNYGGGGENGGVK